MKISKVVGYGVAAAVGAVTTAVLIDRHRKHFIESVLNNTEVGKVISLVDDVMEYDNDVLEIAEQEHEKYTEISRKYKQLCEEFDELEYEYNEMLDYYEADED